MKETCDFNHLILYAKNWYDRSDSVLEDVRKIMAHRCGMYPEHMSDHDVWQCCAMALTMHVEPRHVERFLAEMFKPRFEEKNSFAWIEPNCPLERAIKNVLMLLQELRVNNDKGEEILKLGEPDAAVLPFTQREKWESLKVGVAQSGYIQKEIEKAFTGARSPAICKHGDENNDLCQECGVEETKEEVEETKEESV